MERDINYKHSVTFMGQHNGSIDPEIADDFISAAHYFHSLMLVALHKRKIKWSKDMIFQEFIEENYKVMDAIVQRIFKLRRYPMSKECQAQAVKWCWATLQTIKFML